MAKQIEISVYGIGSAALGGNAGETISIPTQGIFVLPSSKTFNGVVCQSEIQIYPSGLNQFSDSLYSSESVASILAKANAGEEKALVITWDDIANVPVSNASSVSDWNAFFNLPTLGSVFTSVVVDGNDVKLYGGGSIRLKQGLMNGATGGTSLISFVDNSGVVTLSSGYPFYEETSLTTLILPALTSTTNGEFCYACSSLINFSAKSLTSLGGIDNFANCTSLTEINLPSLISCGSSNFFDCNQVTEINLPKCTNLGGSVGNNNVFFGIIGNNISLTIPASRMTANSGNPDGDIQYLQANNTVTITTT